MELQKKFGMLQAYQIPNLKLFPMNAVMDRTNPWDVVIIDHAHIRYGRVFGALPSYHPKDRLCDNFERNPLRHGARIIAGWLIKDPTLLSRSV